MTTLQTTNNPEIENLISRMQYLNSEQGCIVRAFHQPRIRNIESDEPIKQVLRYVFTLIGIRAENIPNDIQKSVLIHYIQNDLKQYSVDDIKIAFHLLLKNELDCDPNHYQSFSAMYLSNVMNAYHKHRLDAIREFQKLQNEMKQQQIENEVTEQEKLEREQRFVRNCIIQPYKFYLKTGEITFGLITYSVIYESLTEKYNVFKLSDSDKNTIYKMAVDQIDQESKKIAFNPDDNKKLQDVRDLIKLKGLETAMKNEIIARCHKISVIKFYESCKNNNVDLESIIEKKLNSLKIETF